MKSGILDTIQNLSTSQASHLKLVNSGQTVPNLAPYLTHSDWTALTSYVTQTDQLQLLAKRLRAMGVQSLKEATKGQAVAIMLMVQSGQGKPCLSPDSINAAVGDFTVVFQALPATTCPGAATYPANPDEMGEVWLRKAYPSEKPMGQEPCLAPWLKKALGLHQVGFCVLSFLTDTYDDKVPLRSTHASLSANNGNRCRGKRPPATPQAAITFE